MKLYDLLKILFVFGVTSLVVAGTIFAVVQAPVWKQISSPVKTIGACDRYARCSVMTEDGSYYFDCRMPIVGANPYCLVKR